ncbi:MAG: acetylornithine deacetylase [Acidobacteriaceae bacterium]
MKTVAELLSDLIRIPSNSAVSNRGVIKYASDVLRGIGWSTREFSYRDPDGVEKVNLIAAPPGQDVARRDVDLVLMCHTDTVPFAAEWTRALDPFVADGHLHGCGACDVKGYLACILAAVSTAGPAADGLRMVLSADEEIGCVGAGHLIASDAIRPRRMIIGEPTSLHPARAGKGYCLAEVTVVGKEAHSAHPAEGISAIARAAQLIVAIERVAGQLARETHPFFDPGYTTVNIGTIQGGTAKNIVPGVCRFMLEWRPVPGQNPDRMLEFVTELVTQWCDADPTFRAEVQPLRRQPGFETSADAGLVRRVEALTGRQAVSIPFGSEASLFAPIAEEVIVWGAGDMRTAHSSRECVPLAELDQAVACLSALIRAA